MVQAAEGMAQMTNFTSMKTDSIFWTFAILATLALCWLGYGFVVWDISWLDQIEHWGRGDRSGLLAFVVFVVLFGILGYGWTNAVAASSPAPYTGRGRGPRVARTTESHGSGSRGDSEDD